MRRVLPSLLVSCGLLVGAGASAEWGDIVVDVNADHPVAVSQQLEDHGEFQRLEIVLTNTGPETLTISDIKIQVPLLDAVEDSMELVYGSSCMGRRPMLRHTVGNPQRKSESFMYAMLQLADNQYSFVGSLSWRVFLPVITLEENAFVIRSAGEGKQLKSGERVQYESIVLARPSKWLASLNAFGSAIAKENGIDQLKDVEFKGWATWDYYAKKFTQADVFGNMDQLNELDPECNLVQIDGGWWTERGDYMTPRPNLPGGVKAIADRIRAEGKIPGLHFDGARGEKVSQIYRTNPDFFLHDEHGEVVSSRKTNNATGASIDMIYFDYSHPGARAYIAECIRTMKEEWGIRYFKVDFLRYGIEKDVRKDLPNLGKIQAYDSSLTSLERFRLGMQTMRDAIGEENYFLGCSAVFGPCIGFVDGMRTGGDVHPRYEAFPERCLANGGNFYLSGKVYNGDCDYLVFREAADEDDTVSPESKKSGGSLALNEASMWADFNKIYGRTRLQSDNLMTLRDERKALVKDVFDWPAVDETIPLDFWQHGKDKHDGYELLLARRGEEIFLGVFNWSDAAKTYQIPAFGRGPSEATLEARHSMVIPYDGKLAFDQLAQQIISAQ